MKSKQINLKKDWKHGKWILTKGGYEEAFIINGNKKQIIY